jgi:hypothetical protein
MPVPELPELLPVVSEEPDCEPEPGELEPEPEPLDEPEPALCAAAKLIANREAVAMARNLLRIAISLRIELT